MCIARNGVPPAVSKNIHLDVHFQPQIKANIQVGNNLPISSSIFYKLDKIYGNFKITLSYFIQSELSEITCNNLRGVGLQNESET